MAEIDKNRIGSDRQIQDPRTALERAQGKYRDLVLTMQSSQRLPLTPQAQCVNPFRR